MNTIVQQMADHCVDVIDEYIDNTIHWQLDDEDLEGDDFNELELKVKQQILFTLIKKVTK
jgi:hypothetical protein